MRKHVTVFLAALLALAVLPGAAVAEDDNGQPGVYLSLGTSLAAGTQADENGDSTILFSTDAYTDQLHKRLPTRYGLDVEHVKLGCPGETAFTFTNGGICYTGGLTQLALAQAVLAEGNVELVTIDLGANDLLQAQPEINLCPDIACVIAILQRIAADVGAVLDAIQSANPGAVVIGMNYYNPNLAAWLGFFAGVPGQHAPNPEAAILSNFIATTGNAFLEAEFLSRGIPVADVERAYRTEDFSDKNRDGVPLNVDLICRRTTMCPDGPEVKPNIHPNKKGYKVITRAFADVLDELFGVEKRRS